MQPVFQLPSQFVQHVHLPGHNLYRTIITLVLNFVHSCTIPMQQLGSIYHSKKNKLTSIYSPIVILHLFNPCSKATWRQTIRIVGFNHCHFLYKDSETIWTFYFCHGRVTIKVYMSDVITTSLTMIISLSILINGLRLNPYSVYIQSIIAKNLFLGKVE